MKVNSKLFFKRVRQIIKFNKSDRVLDIGCGPGYTEILLSPLVKSVYAVDVAEQFINMCLKNCRNFDNVSVGRLKKDDYANLEECNGPFSVIICSSVVQYYRNMDEFEALIFSAKRVASPGALMLIADLPLKRGMLGFIWDAFCSCLLSIRYGYALILFRTAFKRYFFRSHYRAFCGKVGQLYFSINKLNSLSEQLNLDARIIRGDFSIYANRPSLLIRF